MYTIQHSTVRISNIANVTDKSDKTNVATVAFKSPANINKSLTPNW